MKRIFKYIWIAVGILFSFGLWSCDEGNEPIRKTENVEKEDIIDESKIMMEGNYFSYLDITVEDENGADVLKKWNELRKADSESIKKMLFIDLYQIKNSNYRKESLQADAHDDAGATMYSIMVSQNMALVHKDAIAKIRFNLFVDDTDEIVINGLCTEGGRIMQWSFNDKVIPIINAGHKHPDFPTLKLIRHDDGTYTMKE